MQRFLDLIKDEPWVFGIPVDGERTFLSEVGLELREALAIGGEESMARYATKTDGTQIGAQAIAEGMARMAQRAREAGAASPEAQAIDPSACVAAAHDGLPTSRSIRALVGIGRWS